MGGDDDNPKKKPPSAQLGWAGLTGSYYTIMQNFSFTANSNFVSVRGVGGGF